MCLNDKNIERIKSTKYLTFYHLSNILLPIDFSIDWLFLNSKNLSSNSEVHQYCYFFLIVQQVLCSIRWKI